MYMKRFLKFALALLFAFLIAGCGNEGNSNTNATLLLVPTENTLGGGLIEYTATATFSKPVPGVPISFSGKHFKLDGTVLSVNTAEIPTDVAGNASKAFRVLQDQNEITYFEIVASTGGLLRTTTLTVPILVVP